MKKLLLLTSFVALTIPANIQAAIAQDSAPPATHSEHLQSTETSHESTKSGWLKRVEAKYVCMMNNAVFEKEQMAIEVDGKTYYGCCAMCKERLEKDASARQAADPLSGNAVDKATAIIGEHNGEVYYFENEENFKKFSKGPMPKSGHEDHGGHKH